MAAGLQGVPEGVEVRRAGDRFETRGPGRRTQHSFSFAEHYDPANVGFGPLLAHNEDLVEPGHGYPDHAHQELEILTWVLRGVLRHADCAGRVHEVGPGMVQRLCAGRGIRHAETNAGLEPVHFLQMWVRPGAPALPPVHHLAEVGPSGTGWRPLASGSRRDAAVPLSTPGTTLAVAHLEQGATVVIPEGPLVHLVVACGEASVEGVGTLGAGDALRLRGGGRLVTALAEGELLAWSMPDG